MARRPWRCTDAVVRRLPRGVGLSRHDPGLVPTVDDARMVHPVLAVAVDDLADLDGVAAPGTGRCNPSLDYGPGFLASLATPLASGEASATCGHGRKLRPKLWRTGSTRHEASKRLLRPVDRYRL